MRKVALITCLTLAAAALLGVTGVATATFADAGSALVAVVAVALGIFVIGLLEWTHRRHRDIGPALDGADLRVARDRGWWPAGRPATLSTEA